MTMLTIMLMMMLVVVGAAAAKLVASAVAWAGVPSALSNFIGQAQLMDT